jgi:hypothetical protein
MAAKAMMRKEDKKEDAKKKAAKMEMRKMDKKEDKKKKKY